MVFSPLYTLDWLSIAGRGYTDVDGVQWILMEETGFWDSPEPRMDIVDRTNAHGSYIGPIYFNERVLTIKGRAYAQDQATLRRKWTQITGLCADPLRSYAYTCASEVGTVACEVRTDGPVITTPVQVLNVNAFEFSMQLVAADPRKYGTTVTTMRADLPRADYGDGLDFETVEGTTGRKGLDFNPPGLTFGESNSTGFLQLMNAGTAPTTPTYTLHGPLTTPTITATTDGVTAQMTYNATLSETEYVVIDPAAPSVLLGGTASRRWLLNPADFGGFHIPPADAITGQPGVLRVGLQHDGTTTAGGYATATFQDAYF